MKQFFKKLKVAWLVMTNQVRFEQRTLSIQDIDKRLRDLLNKYTTDKYRSVAVKYNTDSECNKSIEYILYSNLGSISSYIDSDSRYPNTLEEAFQVFEAKLKKYTGSKENRVTEDLTIEI